jgi:large subunit ribosomal protein L21
MYAIFESGGRQYRAEENGVIRIDKLEVEVGDKVTFDKVLAVNTGEGLAVGAPYVEGAKVEAQVVETGRARKIIVFKYRPKSQYKRIRGHRQDFTAVRVTGIAG